MIVWRGWGILVLLITALCYGLGGLITIEVLSIPESSIIAQSVFLFCYLLSGAAIFFIGKRLNEKQESVHHSFLFIRMEYWGIAVPVFGIILFIINLIK